MNAHTLKARANRARILATATRNIAEHGFAHATLERIMAGTGLHKNSIDPHFGNIHRLLAAICERHAHALLEATGGHDPADPATPRAALVAAAARILACIDAHPDAHTVLMRDRACLPPAQRAGTDHLDTVAALQIDCAWSALRPDLASPERYAALTRTLRTLLLHWPDWRQPGPPGHPDAAADRCVAMVEATIDRPAPASAHTPWPPRRTPNPHAHWMSDEAAARCTVMGPVPPPAPQGTDPQTPPARTAPQDAPRPAPPDTRPDAPPAPAHPGLTLREALASHGLPPTLAATRLGVTRQRLHELTRGTRAITPNTALRLEALLGEHAETWMARQARHDIHAERERTEG